MAYSELIKCGCCNGDVDGDETFIDDQLGPLCEPCHKACIAAVAWLKHAKIPRPIQRDDINEFNFKRFQIPPSKNEI